MTEPIPAQPPAPTTPPAAQEPQTPPPWGDDSNFDPARAWSLIENLRAEKESLSKRPTVTPEQQRQLADYQALVEASKSEQQRKDEALAAAERAAETARNEAIRYKAAATYGVPQEHFDLLGAGTEEEVSARAEKIRNLIAAQAAAQTPTPPVAPPITRPIEQLRPGATPATAATEDDVVMASLGFKV